MKTATIADFLTHEEIKKATKLYQEVGGTPTFAKTCRDEIILPVITRINKQLGQENDPLYLAYAVEYSFLKGQAS